MASTDTNRLFAFQSGADGYLVRPVHADEIVDTVRVVLGRTGEERTEYRRAQLMGGATTA
jgi:DNA-binding response OmpR family regulator